MSMSTTGDKALLAAVGVVDGVRSGCTSAPVVAAFFHEPTNTVSYVVHDPVTNAAAIIDSVLDYDAASGRTSHAAADRIVAHVEAAGLHVDWLLETHVHADHLSAAQYLRDRLGGKVAIGSRIVDVQQTFGSLFNADDSFRRDGSQFDRLFGDGDLFTVGSIPIVVLHVPGHTPADAAYVIGDAVFPGDTLFMPDFGTARCDFPGGDARQLYRSIHRLLALPSDARLFICHDYKATGRDVFAWETTIGDERAANIHVGGGTDEDAFVAMREARDRTLPVPRLLLPSIQVNMRAGQLPDPEANGLRYLKMPLDAF